MSLTRICCNICGFPLIYCACKPADQKTGEEVTYEEFVATKRFADVPAGFDPGALNASLFPFQEACVRWALKRGRAALFLDTGLGKTICQAVWADEVARETGGDVLILAPLCVAQQTVTEAAKFGITIRYCRDQAQCEAGITVTNYEMLEHFDPADFAGVVLDESSILKAQDGKTRTALIEACRDVPYRLSCSATPSPNDFMELGSQAQFLGLMSVAEMLAMFFTHDGSDTSKWRLKGHGKTKFWEWMATWAVCIRKPSDLGFDDAGYNLPPFKLHEHLVTSEKPLEGQLFPGIAGTLQERRQAQRESISERVERVAQLVNGNKEQWIVWCHLNDESDQLVRAIDGAVEIRGSNSLEEKQSRMLSFIKGEHRVLVSKASVCGYGMNLQFCHNAAFVGLDDSFEQFYQAIRRCYRFGQKSIVNVHLVIAESEGAVRANLERKQAQALQMVESMVSHMRELTQQKIRGAMVEKSEYAEDVAKGENWTLHLGDCVKVAERMPDESIGYTIFSPPFASLYTYSNSDHDMGNVRSDEEFMGQFAFLVEQLYRITKPGRLLSFHCMNLPTSKSRQGFIGIKDFRGDLIRCFQDRGWIFHSEVCIWKDPVTAMQRTKALGLLWKQIKKDSAMSRQGIPDYLVTMRKPGENASPIAHTPDQFPVAQWQQWASPVWMDINQSKTLQYRDARENDDERHICPLQLEVIERGLGLWSNPGDTVFSPFAGIGSEGYMAVVTGRKFIGAELKRSYFELACKNIQQATLQQAGLFAQTEEAA